MTHTAQLNPLAQRVWVRLLAAHPTWQAHFGENDGDLEVAIPAPAGSKAGHLVIFTDQGEHLWVRYAPPCMCYALDNENEMLSIIDQLLADQAVFVVIMNGNECVETTLVKPGVQPNLQAGQVAHLVSWLGTHDQNIPGPSRL